MGNEKGLTLVELLAVIVILGIIAAIAIPAIGGIISNAQDDAKQANEDLLINAARLMVASQDNEKASYTDKELADKGYLEAELKGYKGTVTINEDNGKYTYKVDLEEKSDDEDEEG
ncbi:prepilin-type N-terminal cleavage/methylation domain-containing protein [Bacillus sp. H-16]|nr:prepilin-type N-terminal cleavage/methylation domain-containing protein [Alteribacter salitolerans]MBM7096580.1 prepilin-type N-terminal cleavage/methylation domain-containing protein [Alteribacter salitolerans]